MRIRSWVARICGAATVAALLLSTLPSKAATRPCVQDAYNYLNTTPAGATRSIKMSLNGMWGGGGTAGLYSPWSFFAKSWMMHSYNATYGGSILKSNSVTAPNFYLDYDYGPDSGWWAQPAQLFTVQAIPVDDLYPVRLSGNGGTFLVDAKCVGTVLAGADQYGYFWTLAFSKSQSVVN